MIKKSIAIVATLIGKKSFKPFTFLAITTISIFLCEILIMFLLHYFKLQLSLIVECIIDASLLSFLTFFLLYFFLFKPMLLNIKELERVEEEKRELEKLRIIKSLATTLGHEMNNILQNINLANIMLKKNNDCTEYNDIIEDSIKILSESIIKITNMDKIREIDYPGGKKIIILN